MEAENSLERAKRHAATMYPEARIVTKSVRGKPAVLAIEGDVIHLVAAWQRRKRAARK